MGDTGKKAEEGTSSKGRAWRRGWLSGALARALVLIISLLCLPAPLGATPWTETAGNCTFSGDTAGAPLVRSGSCATYTGSLSLSNKGITQIPGDAFSGMGALT